MELDLQIPGSDCLFRQYLSHLRREWLDSAWKHRSVPQHERTRVAISGICRNKINKDFFSDVPLGIIYLSELDTAARGSLSLNYLWPFPELTGHSLPHWPKYKAKSFSDNSLWKKSSLFCIFWPSPVCCPTRVSAAQHLQRTVLHVAFGFAGLGGTPPKWGRYSLGILVGMWPRCVCVSSCVCPHKMKAVFYLKPINFHFIWCVHYLQVLMSILSHIMRQQETC